MSDATAADLPIEKLSLRTKFLYGAGAVEYGARIYVMGLLLFYYNQIVGLPGPMVSLALSISLFVDAFWDPFIGQFSDNLRTKWGRRHPLMYASIVPFFIFFVLLWRPPEGMTDWQTFAWLLSMVLLTRFSVSLYEVTAQALGPELAPDYHDRTVMMGIRYLMLVGGGAIATSLGFFYYFRATPEFPSGQLNPAAWGPLTLSVAVMMVISILVAAIGTHHRIPTLHKPPARKVGFKQALGDVVGTLKNWNFMVAVIAALISGMGAGLTSGLQLYFDTFFWGLPAGQVGILAMIQLLAALLASMTAPALSRMFGKKRACMTLFFASVAFGAAPYVLRLMELMPENGAPGLLGSLIGFRLVSITLGVGGYIIVTSMIADITDDALAKTGRRSEGLLMSADGLLNQVTTAMSSLLPGLILAAVHFPAKAQPGMVAEETLRQLVIIYLPITVAMSCLSIATWSFYRIDQKTHENNLRTARQAAAVAETSLEAGEPTSVARRPI
ncbi:MAG TPA: MFS transporter [Phenylobacterium sp.]